ncbi:universal stress protein [Arthrobacter pigmenti]
MTHQPASDEPFAPGPEEIVVGVDGAETNAVALSWALQEATLRDRRLWLLTAYNVPLAGYTASAGAYHDILDGLRKAAELAASEALETATAAGVDASAALVESEPAAALIQASETAGLVVVGSRALSRLGGRILGSVSGALPGHTHCPTVIVPHPDARSRKHHRRMEQEPMPAATDVVVGVDGSAEAAAAALVAAEYAQRRGLGLTLIWARPAESSHIPWVLTEAEVAEYQSWTDHEASWLRGHFPTLDISAHFVERVPVEALSEATATADLVVVGNRGRGGFAGLIMGSTSRSLVHHIRGPVMIVPFDKKRIDPRLENRMHAVNPTRAAQ